MAVSIALATDIINHFFLDEGISAPATLYLALFTVAPDIDGDGGTEATGGSYARQAITFTPPDTDGVSYNSNQLTYTNLAQTSFVAGGVYTHLTAGVFWARSLFSLPQEVAVGGSLVVRDGLIALRVR